jgi:hypothetical protein
MGARRIRNILNYVTESWFKPLAELAAGCTEQGSCTAQNKESVTTQEQKSENI